ncbi:hypothetical protein [Methanoculleus sp.]|uniref:hypothetical protein n=1 Tax=Methanoculleus sp. TaxID=90427 RepID=UPI0025FF4CB9|nr:hypothetical protein [Methanoculleus sp.]MCK9320299.1 hypothetical protein [Methanoculleus sp.]
MSEITALSMRTIVASRIDQQELNTLLNEIHTAAMSGLVSIKTNCSSPGIHRELINRGFVIEDISSTASKWYKIHW